MKFYRKDFQIYRDWITIIPTIDIQINNMCYVNPNVSIQFHWLVFHARLMWMESEE